MRNPATVPDSPKRSDPSFQPVNFQPLNAVLDEDAALREGWRLADLAVACLAGGARFLQLRSKHVSSGALLETAVAIVREAQPFGALVVVNDRADIARMAGAGGVHVGQDDLPPAAVRRIVGSTCVVGLSTHTIKQIEAAVAEPVDYIAIGPVFGTSSKETGYAPVGLELVREAAARARPRGLRVVAIGGITLDRAADVLRAGADSVAVIGDLLRTRDPRARVREYLDQLGSQHT